MNRVQIDVPVREHYTFGISAGAAGIEKFRDGIFVNGSNVSAMRRGCSEEFFVVLGREPSCFGSAVQKIDLLYRRNVIAKGFRHSKQLLLDEQSSDAGVVENVAQFAGREPDVQRKQYSAGFQYSVIRLQQAMTIATKERDALARLNASLTQSARQATGSLGQLRVRETIVIAHDRGAARILLRRVPQKTQRREWNIHGVSRLDQAD